MKRTLAPLFTEGKFYRPQTCPARSRVELFNAGGRHSLR